MSSRGSSLRREMKAEASFAKIKKNVKADSALPGQERACRGLAQALPQQLQHNNTGGSPSWEGEGPWEPLLYFQPAPSFILTRTWSVPCPRPGLLSSEGYMRPEECLDCEVPARHSSSPDLQQGAIFPVWDPLGTWQEGTSQPV